MATSTGRFWPPITLDANPLDGDALVVSLFSATDSSRLGLMLRPSSAIFSSHVALMTRASLRERVRSVSLRAGTVW